MGETPWDILKKTAPYLVITPCDYDTIERLEKEDSLLTSKIEALDERKNYDLMMMRQEEYKVRRIHRRIDKYYCKKFKALSNRKQEINASINEAIKVTAVRLQVGTIFLDQDGKKKEYLGLDEKGEHIFREVDTK